MTDTSVLWIFSVANLLLNLSNDIMSTSLQVVRVCGSDCHRLISPTSVIRRHHPDLILHHMFWTQDLLFVQWPHVHNYVTEILFFCVFFFFKKRVSFAALLVCFIIFQSFTVKKLKSEWNKWNSGIISMCHWEHRGRKALPLPKAHKKTATFNFCWEKICPFNMLHNFSTSHKFKKNQKDRIHMSMVNFITPTQLPSRRRNAISARHVCVCVCEREHIVLIIQAELTW